MLGEHRAWGGETHRCGSCFVVRTDPGEACLFWDLLDIRLPCEGRSGLSSSAHSKVGKDP